MYASKIYKGALILGIIIVFSLVPAFWFSYSASPDLELSYLDVGQGDSILIKTPYGQNILVDGGPDDKVISELNKNMAWWDRRIDLMILSHPHDDHVNGLTEVLKRYSVKRIVYTGVVHSSPNYLRFLEKVRDKKIPLTIIDRPQIISLGDELFIDILYPRKSILGKEVDNINSSSIVMRLVFKETSFLFSGDAEIEVEEELVELFDEGYNILDSDVFKAGHHGSDTSNSQNFLEVINPEIVIIQVGEDNDFGHPSLRAIKRFERIGAEVFRNDMLGGISLISDGYSVKYEDSAD